jgi:hypothetical protein
MAYNVTRIALRRLRGGRRLHLVLSEAALGTRRLPGVLAVVPLLALERGWEPLRRFRDATAGRLAALRDWRRGR